MVSEKRLALMLEMFTIWSNLFVSGALFVQILFCLELYLDYVPQGCFFLKKKNNIQEQEHSTVS